MEVVRKLLLVINKYLIYYSILLLDLLEQIVAKENRLLNTKLELIYFLKQ